MSDESILQRRALGSAFSAVACGSIATFYYLQGSWPIGAIWTLSTGFSLSSVWHLTSIAYSKGALSAWRKANREG